MFVVGVFKIILVGAELVFEIVRGSVVSSFQTVCCNWCFVHYRFEAITLHRALVHDVTVA